MPYNIIIPLTRPELFNRCISYFKNQDIIAISDMGHKLGVAKVRNEGAKLAAEKWLLFVDDDVYFKEKPFFELDEKFDILYPQVYYDDGSKMHPRDDAEQTFPRMSTCFMIKKESFDRLGGFDEEYNFYFEDEDFFERAFRAGLAAKFLQEVVAYHPVIARKPSAKSFYRVMRNSVYYYLKFGQFPRRPLSKVLINDAGHMIIRQKHYLYTFPYIVALFSGILTYFKFKLRGGKI